MKVLYTRVSTTEQNIDRQVIDKDKYDYVLIDKCSGSIPLFERPNGVRGRRCNAVSLTPKNKDKSYRH